MLPFSHLWVAERARKIMEPTMPKFDKTYCSQCGGEFGPGDGGFSHCNQHAGQTNRDTLSPTVKRVMERFESALARRRAYGPPPKH